MTDRVRTKHSYSTVDTVLGSSQTFNEIEYDVRIDAYGNAFNPRTTYCEDVINNRHGDNPFSLRSSTINPGYLSYTNRIRHSGGLESPGDDVYTTKRWGSFRDTQSRNGYDAPDDDVEFVTQACANTNPSAAEFDASIFLGELKDVPRLLHSAGRNLSKFGSSEYLKYQYGWKPLVKDVKNLLGSYDKLSKRIAEIERLKNKQVVKRRFNEPTIDVFVNSMVDEVSLASHGIRATTQWNADRRRWCVVKWVPDLQDDILHAAQSLVSSHSQQSSSVDLAKQALLGQTIDGSTLWNLMPWSWMMDWGYNASAFLESQRNIVGAKVGSTCLMTSTTYFSTTNYSSMELPLGPGDTVMGQSLNSTATGESWVTKTRRVDLLPAVTSVSGFNLVKDLHKQSILGALGLQRLKRLPF